MLFNRSGAIEVFPNDNKTVEFEPTYSNGISSSSYGACCKGCT